MLVHHHEPGDHRPVREIEHACAFRNLQRARGSRGGDTPVGKHERLVLDGSCARAVDHTHVAQRDHRYVNGYETLHARRADRRRRLCGDRRRGYQRSRKGKQGGGSIHGQTIAVRPDVTNPAHGDELGENRD